MPLSANAKSTLAELRKSGVDPKILASLERDLDKKPKALQSFDRKLLSASAFTKYQTSKETELKQLREQLTELQTLQKTVDTTKNPQLLEQAKERIVELEEALIASGNYSEEEVKNWSLKEKNAIDEILESIGEDDSNSDDELEDDNNDNDLEEEDNMPNNNKRKYVDEDKLNDVVRTSMMNTSRAGVVINAKILASLSRYTEVFGKAPNAKQIDEFTTKFWDKMDRGEITDFDSGLEKHTNEFFKIPEELENRNKAELEAKLKEAEEKGRKAGAEETAKEMGGYPSRRRSTLNNQRSRLFDNKRDKIKEATLKGTKDKSETDDSDNGTVNNLNDKGNTKMIDGFQVPINKNGDVEMYKVRKQFSDRGNYDRYTERFDKAVEMNGGVED